MGLDLRVTSAVIVASVIMGARSLSGISPCMRALDILLLPCFLSNALVVLLLRFGFAAPAFYTVAFYWRTAAASDRASKERSGPFPHALH